MIERPIGIRVHYLVTSHVHIDRPELWTAGGPGYGAARVRVDRQRFDEQAPAVRTFVRICQGAEDYAAEYVREAYVDAITERFTGWDHLGPVYAFAGRRTVRRGVRRERDETPTARARAMLQVAAARKPHTLHLAFFIEAAHA